MLLNQGNLLKGIDKKTVRREGISIFFTWFIFDNQKLLNNSDELQQSIIVESTNEINRETKDVIEINTPVTMAIPVPEKNEPKETSSTDETDKEEP